MKDTLILIAHLLTTIAQLLGPGGAKAIVADSLLMKHQLLIINRSRKRSPKLTVMDRFVLGLPFSFPTSSPHSKSSRNCTALYAVKISRITQEA